MTLSFQGQMYGRFANRPYQPVAQLQFSYTHRSDMPMKSEKSVGWPPPFCFAKAKQWGGISGQGEGRLCLFVCPPLCFYQNNCHPEVRAVREPPLPYLNMTHPWEKQGGAITVLPLSLLCRLNELFVSLELKFFQHVGNPDLR